MKKHLKSRITKTSPNLKFCFIKKSSLRNLYAMNLLIGPLRLGEMNLIDSWTLTMLKPRPFTFSLLCRRKCVYYRKTDLLTFSTSFKHGGSPRPRGTLKIWLRLSGKGRVNPQNKQTSFKQSYHKSEISIANLCCNCLKEVQFRPTFRRTIVHSYDGATGRNQKVQFLLPLPTNHPFYPSIIRFKTLQSGPGKVTISNLAI